MVKTFLRSTYIRNADELFDGSCTPPRILLAKNRFRDPIRNLKINLSFFFSSKGDNPHPITRLDNSSNIIIMLRLLFSRSLETLHRPNLLIQLTLHDRQLSRQLQRIDIKQFQLLRRFRHDRRRWNSQPSCCSFYRIISLLLFASCHLTKSTRQEANEIHTARSMNINNCFAAANRMTSSPVMNSFIRSRI
jgi:hypothetical protein